jgi:hypothetical protein
LAVDSGGYTGETMQFTASKTGDYYIQVKVNSGSGFYDIIVELGSTMGMSGPNVGFFDVSYLLVLILPTIFIVVVGLLVMRKRVQDKDTVKKMPVATNIYRRATETKSAVSVKKEEVMICEFCGSEITKNLKICPHCNTSLT